MKKRIEKGAGGALWAKAISPVAALLAVCVISAALLGAAHTVTKEPIEEAQARAELESMMSVLPEGAERCEDMAAESGSRCCRALDGSGNTVAYAVETSANGYGGVVRVMTGVGLDGRVLAVSVYDNSTETPGLGAKTSEEEFTEQFVTERAVSAFKVSKDISGSENCECIDAVTGATISSRAVAACVTHALEVCRKAREESHE